MSMTLIRTAQAEDDPRHATPPWSPWGEDDDSDLEQVADEPDTHGQQMPDVEPRRLSDMTYLPGAPEPETAHPPVDPAAIFDEYAPLPESGGQGMGLRDKIWSSMNEVRPLRMIYTSLLGSTTERTVHPDYVYWAGTNRHVMVAWDEMRGDWRQFIVNRIRDAELEEIIEP